MTLFEKIAAMANLGYELDIIPQRRGGRDRVACLSVWKYDDIDIPRLGESAFLTELDLMDENQLCDIIDEIMLKLDRRAWKNDNSASI